MKIDELYRYPIKGLTGQELTSARLVRESGIPGDRLFALVFVDRFTDSTREVPWMKKQNFANQNDWPTLAALHCSWDEKSGVLSVHQGDQELLRAGTKNDKDRDKIDIFFTNYLKSQVPSKKASHPKASPVRLVGRNQNRYPDRNMFALSILNKNSLKDLGQRVGKELDIRSFRGNIIIDDLPAWKELELLGQEATVGSARLLIQKPIARCLNINVDPDTGVSEPKVLAELAKFNQGRFGVMADVLVEGTAKVGESINIERPHVTKITT
jgi:uncharacterized protein YcbX